MSKILRSTKRLLRRLFGMNTNVSEMANLERKLREADEDYNDLFPFEPGDCCHSCKFGQAFTEWCDRNARRAHRLAWLYHKKDIADKVEKIQYLYRTHDEVEGLGPYPPEAYEV